jgi:hypothetical protein
MSKSVLLGEALPLLQLLFQDSHGNTVPPGSDGLPAVTLQVLEAGPGGGGAVLQELQATSDMVRWARGMLCVGGRLCSFIHLREIPPALTSITLRVPPHSLPQEVQSDGCICLNNLRVLASAAPGSCSGGLVLFGPRQPPASAAEGGGKEHRSTRGTVRCAASGPAKGLPIVRAVDVYLAAAVDGMPQQVGGSVVTASEAAACGMPVRGRVQ